MNAVKNARLAACTAFLVALGSVAQASPSMYYFSGAFTVTSGASTAFANQDFSGQFAYDTDWVPIFSGGNFNQYRMPAGGLTASSLDGGSSSQAAPNNLVNVAWGSGISSAVVSGFGDYLYVNSISDFTGSWQGFYVASLILLDVDRTALGLNLSALPASLPDLASWSGTEFRIFDQAGGSDAAGALTCVSTDAAACALNRVPEPAILSLFAIGLAGLGFRRYGRSGQV